MNPARREELANTALAVVSEVTSADGWLWIEATFQDLRHAVWAVWQLDTDAEALAPKALRTALYERATRITGCYKNSS